MTGIICQNLFAKDVPTLFLAIISKIFNTFLYARYLTLQYKR